MMISGPVYREEGFFMLALFSVSVLMAGSSWLQPFVLLRGVGLPGRRFFPQEGASGAGWEKSL